MNDMKQYSFDHKGRCRKCHKFLSEDDRFCRYCGTPKGKGLFLPYENVQACVYGPPVDTFHTCSNCGFSWTVSALGIDRAAFCPKCGGQVSTDYTYKPM